MKCKNFIKGYVCRSKNSDTITIAKGTELPSQKEDGWFWYVPGWFYTMTTRTFKKAFGFSIKPGTYKLIDISISEKM